MFSALKIIGVTTATRDNIKTHEELQIPIWLIVDTHQHFRSTTLLFGHGQLQSKEDSVLDSIGMKMVKSDLELLQKFIVLTRARSAILWKEWEFYSPRISRQQDDASCRVHICMYASIAQLEEQGT